MIKILKILKKYKNKIIIYEEKTFEEFNQKYHNHISSNNKIIDLKDKRGGDEMLKDLYFIIPYNNEIKELNLRNNNIHDTFILTRIHLPNLEVLDLSLNNITNLKFLYKMKLNNLRELFLDNNKINDISPLITIDSPYLKIITLNNNNFDINEIKNILKKLKEKYY